MSLGELLATMTSDELTHRYQLDVLRAKEAKKAQERRRR